MYCKLNILAVKKQNLAPIDGETTRKRDIEGLPGIPKQKKTTSQAVHNVLIEEQSENITWMASPTPYNDMINIKNLKIP